MALTDVAIHRVKPRAKPFNTLGQSLVRSMDERFDQQLAEESLLFFNLRDIPAIRDPLPNGVSDVRFRIHLNNCKAIKYSNLPLDMMERQILPAKDH